MQKIDREVHGFRVLQTEELKEINATLIKLRHQKTGAHYTHLQTDDKENLFGVGFKTTPLDSTGVAHILEHTVLCGSRRFPVRDIFFSMLNRSLNTFMNALTSSDWTFYPFATQNYKDFTNLMDVYLDSTFFPLLRETDFSQEGIRFELKEKGNKQSELAAKGVVYNEMKGAMANPSSLIHRRLNEALYPTTTYGKNSGGEPREILNLTWEDLKTFHENYYHPSNAYFFSYGNFPLDKSLEKVDAQVLKHFDARQVDSTVPDEERYREPLQVVRTFPLPAGESMENRSMVQLGWLTCPISDNYHRLGLTLLSILLLGDSAAPLHKALIDSRLGENICPGSGYQDESRETYLAAGIQGTNPQHFEEIESLILTTLEDAAKKGFSEKRIESAMHQLEFAHREVVGGHYPYGLLLLMRLLGPWIHNDDPVSSLHFQADLEKIRLACRQGPFFENLIREYLLDNPHRVSLLLKPDPDQEEREQKETESYLKKLHSGFTEKETEDLIARAEALQSFQEQEEDVSILPTLELDDIPEKEEFYPRTEDRVAGSPVFFLEQPTNGIGYFSAYVSLQGLADNLKPFLPVFCFLLTRMGAADYDYLTLAEKIAAHTGGIRAGALILSNPLQPDSFSEVFEIKGKALARNQGEMFHLLRDIFTSPDFSDLQRLKTALDQLKISLENSIPGSGHHFAARTAGSSLSAVASRKEAWGGLTFIKKVKTLTEMNEDELRGFSKEMKKIAEFLSVQSCYHCSAVGEKERLDEMKKAMEPFMKVLPAVPSWPAPFKEDFIPKAEARAWAASLPVSYNTRAFRTVPFVHEDNAPFLVLAKLLRTCFLHREIREKGGAYGGLASFEPETGLFTMLSYRDPHLVRTLKVFREAAEWAVAGRFSDQDVKEAILGVFSDLDRPLSPSGKGEHETILALKGITLEMRQNQRKRVLAVTREKLMGLAEKYLLKDWANGAVGVLSSEKILLEANKKLDGEVLTILKF
ncbi:MAG: insulinase family protein [Deltaproteobacteria bacterium]|nr:insulinase family protein [Deltaproteobacteria bacterium]